MPINVKSSGYSGWEWILSGLLPVAIFMVLFPDYLPRTTFFWIGIITLPFSYLATSSKTNWLFIFSIAMALLSFFAPTTIGIYVLMCLLILFILDRKYGSPGVLLLFQLFLISPLFEFGKAVISFPIRIYLSTIVSALLHFVGLEVQMEGNLVTLGETSFLVDEACAGLHMLSYGLLTGTLILAYFSKRTKISFGRLSIYYLLLLFLILISNIIRITILIIFKIMPEYWLHEFLGLIIYVIYVLLPFFLLLKKTFPSKPLESKSSIKYAFPRFKYTLLLLLFVIAAYKNDQRKTTEVSYQKITLEGFTTSKLVSGVTKLTDKNSLIYIKPPVAGYHADHNPMICWQGSGYRFDKIDSWEIDAFSVNHAELIHGNDRLYTAWWFESRNLQTADQWTWRKHAFIKGEKFFLINLTCNTEKELRQKLHELLPKAIASPSKNL